MNKGSLTKYIRQIANGIAVLALIAGIYFPIGYIDFQGHEPRSRFFVALDQGALFWGTLAIILPFIVYKLAKADKYFKSFAIVFIWAISASIFYISLSDLTPAHTDIAVFKNEGQESLIIQYYETGVTGNPRSRLIRTGNINSSLRKYEEIHNAPVLDSLHIENRNFEERIPKLYIASNDTFLLKKIHNPWKE